MHGMSKTHTPRIKKTTAIIIVHHSDTDSCCSFPCWDDQQQLYISNCITNHIPLPVSSRAIMMMMMCDVVAMSVANVVCGCI
jgi:hypothetical protein